MTEDGEVEVQDILEIKMYSWRAPQLAINIRHYRVGNIVGEVGLTMQEIVDSMTEDITPLYIGIMSESAAFLGCAMQDRVGHPLLSHLEVFHSAGSPVGLIAGDAMPTQTCGIITLRTGVVGRQNRGRMYLPFPSEESNSSIGIPTNTYVASLTTIGTYFTSPISITIGLRTTVLQPVVLHRANLSSNVLFTAIARQKWATQRRRGGYGRANTPPIWSGV